MSAPTPRTPDGIASAIATALDGQTITGADSYTLGISKAKDPTDVTSQGSVWADGAFVVLIDTSETQGRVTGASTSPAVRWKARYLVLVEVLQRIPADPAIRWSNVLLVPQEIQNLIDVALETSTTMNYAVKDRQIPMTKKEPGKDFYRMQFKCAIEEWWDHT